MSETSANASHTHHNFTNGIDVYEVYAKSFLFILSYVISESKASDSCSCPSLVPTQRCHGMSISVIGSGNTSSAAEGVVWSGNELPNPICKARRHQQRCNFRNLNFGNDQSWKNAILEIIQFGNMQLWKLEIIKFGSIENDNSILSWSKNASFLSLATENCCTSKHVDF